MGLRPNREPIRLEKEILSTKYQNKVLVIHSVFGIKNKTKFLNIKTKLFIY